MRWYLSALEGYVGALRRDIGSALLGNLRHAGRGLRMAGRGLREMAACLLLALAAAVALAVALAVAPVLAPICVWLARK